MKTKFLLAQLQNISFSLIRMKKKRGDSQMQENIIANYVFGSATHFAFSFLLFLTAVRGSRLSSVIIHNHWENEDAR